jgi:GGDEF domain-containing protein
VSRDRERSELQPLVVLELARWERRAEMQAAYDALAEDIARLGFDVEVNEAIERRSGGTTFTPALADLVVYLKEAVEEHVVDAVVAAIVARVSVHAGWPRKRTAIILAPDGETVLRRVKLSDPA